jgi:peptidoglycan hydrolase CwlO-like protein
MSFSKTISTVAALTTIFGASIAAWKVVQYNQSQEPQIETKELEQKIEELQKQLDESKKILTAPTPPPPPLVEPTND